MDQRDTPGTDELMECAGRGDDGARERLLARYRGRLRREIAARLDRRIAARVDASDIVQESLIDAHKELPEYLRRRPLPFLAWLRQIARERLAKSRRFHLLAQRRCVAREGPLPAADASATGLVDRLADSLTSPSGRLERDERRARVRAALERLGPRDREVLVLRSLRQASASEVAATLGITERAAKARHCRALERLRVLLEGDPSGSVP
ncbi:MAG TPA: sigma-70 family RNA polymerase sigma factor [Isosphaeraceae bacterium]|jgi:RNA polymerase sigma-70 factor (ECF subfamily)|nr:sigma-70 family RNA polymerase sigma factor [Isosphaeraceae bacterium]